MSKITSIGPLKLLCLLPRIIYNPLKSFIYILEKYGQNIQFYVGNHVLYLITNPNDVKHILKDNQDNYSRGKAMLDLKQLLGKGLFRADNKLWEQQHKILRPAFHGELLKSYSNELQNSVTNFCSYLEKNPAKIDLQYELKKLMLGIQLKTQFGEINNTDLDKIIKALDYSIEYSMLFEVKIRDLKKALGISSNKAVTKFNNHVSELENYVERLIQNGITKNIIPGASLALMIEAHEKGLIDKKQIRDEIMNLLFAGFDTVAESLFFTFYEIAKNKSIEQKLYLEAIAANQSPDLMQAIKKLTYTKMVIQEGLRLHSVAWGMPRVAINEDTFNGITIPKNAFVGISPYLNQRDKQYWKKPDEFNPERFGKNTKPKHPFSYFPFGQGKHICLGNQLAMIQMQTVLPEIIKKFKLELVTKKEPIVKTSLILKTRKEVYFKFIKR